MKKTLTIILILLFAGASLFAQKPHHKKDGHKEIKKEYKHHHKSKTVVIQPTAPRPPSVNIQVTSPPKPKSPSPPPPPRPPR